MYARVGRQQTRKRRARRAKRIGTGHTFYEKARVQASDDFRLGTDLDHGPRDLLSAGTGTGTGTEEQEHARTTGETLSKRTYPTIRFISTEPRTFIEVCQEGDDETNSALHPLTRACSQTLAW